MSKVSIIIPAYNSSLFIKRAVNSVQNQTFTDWELLVIDDCSTDDTVMQVEEFTKNDSRIKLYKTSKNSGNPAAPKNLGFKFSSGEYIAYLDHDDEWLPNKLDEQINVFVNSPEKNIGLVSCGALLINDQGKCFSVFIPVKKENSFPEILLKNPIYSNSSVLIKREVIEHAGERDENMKYSEDWDMWIRIIKLGYNIDYIYKPLFKYYFHKDNATKTSGEIIKIKDVEYVLQKHQDLYLKYNYMHVGFFRLGVMYLLEGNLKISREHFFKSIKENKIFIPSYLGYILSVLGFFGVMIFRFIIFVYRFYHVKRSLISFSKT